MRKFLLYITIALIFFIPIGAFAYAIITYVPSRFGAMILGLVGFTIIIVGPFWAMMLEKRMKGLPFFQEKSKWE